MAIHDRRPVLAMTLLLALTGGCATETAHDRFKMTMQGEVGRSVDDQNALLTRYPENRRGSRGLSNGNTEERFHFRRTCEVFFEVDKARKIIGWRYEGATEDCGVA